MIEEVRGLVDQYAQWVRDKSVLREINDQYVQITTPYLDRHNDYTQIYVGRENGGFVLTDGGARATDEHRAIAMAVRKKDVKVACQLMRTHILGAGQSLLKMLENQRATTLKPPGATTRR